MTHGMEKKKDADEPSSNLKQIIESQFLNLKFQISLFYFKYSIFRVSRVAQR